MPLAEHSGRYGVLVVGAGGHGRVVADLARAMGWACAGFADADLAQLGRTVDAAGARVVVTQAALLSAAEHGRLPAGVEALALGVGDNAARAVLLDLLGGVPLPTLVHPAATVSAGARLGAGTTVMAAAVVNTGAEVGRAVIVNSGAVVEHDCQLDDAAHVSPRAVLAGGVAVGSRGWVGAGATVLPGIRVGVDSIVGAGAVVVRDVPDGAVVVGNPARVLRRRDPRA